MLSLFLISTFGAFGVLCRYGVDHLFVRWNAQIPLSTLAVNITGSFLAGMIFAVGMSKDSSSGIQTALLVGFCGGFTTFSAYTLQTLDLIERGKVFLAVAYLFGSPLLGVAAALIPILIFKNLNG